MKKLICIVCPKGCHLNIDEKNDYKITGNNCPKGIDYGINELKNPQRVITTTVAISNSSSCRLPVKTNKTISKKLVFQCMEEINKVCVKTPVFVGDVIIKNILNTGSDVVACKNVK